MDKPDKQGRDEESQVGFTAFNGPHRSTINDRMDLSSLDPKEFEFLVGMLLVREGFRILRTPGEVRSGLGPDFEALGPDGRPTIVEAKLFRRTQGVPTSLLSQFLGEVERFREQSPSASGILVLSGALNSRALESVREHEHVDIWDGQFIQQLLTKYPDLWPAVTQAVSARINLEKKLLELKTKISSPTNELIQELRDLDAGPDTWKQYEVLGTRILTQIFHSDLGSPERHNRTEDGLDIMDAIFPIRSWDPPWSLVRSEYRSRFVVAEFKNYSDPIGQRQVESIQQYLWAKAQRSFGLLVSRSGPDESATKARRRAWLESDKLIVFLDDDDLIGMLQMAETDDEPFGVVDAQLENFFRHLNP